MVVYEFILVSRKPSKNDQKYLKVLSFQIYTKVAHFLTEFGKQFNTSNYYP